MKKGLGRGLDSLFGSYEDTEEVFEERENGTFDASSASGEPTEIEIGLIDRNPSQPRTNFDQDALQELANSIKVHGVIQPIIVNKKDDRYVIVAGERRWRASRLAGLKTVPCVVKNYSNQEMSEISIIENLQRENLNPIESARAIQNLISNYSLTQEEVADKIGKSRPVVANTLRLLTLPEQIVSLIESGKLSAGHARALLALDDQTKQKELALSIIQKGLSVREVENFIKDIKSSNSNIKSEPLKKHEEQSAELKDFQTKLNRILATKVSIKGNDKKGKIEIEYYSTEDLNRIYDLFKNN